MPDADDMTLVREFADRKSEQAFEKLVQRHINLVYSIALRFTGNVEDAQDVVQAVFIILARKAGSLRQGTILTGWLYETTRFTAMKFLRTKIRRQAREQEAYMQSNLDASNTESAWKQLAPFLEEAMARLTEKERTLLALRFFENRSGAETAAILGIQEWAAHKRANRAVEKLRQFFANRGVVIPAAVLTAAISVNSVQAAPAALAKTTASVAITKGVIASNTTLSLVNGTLKIMAWTKAQTGVVGAILAASILIPLALQHQAQARMREEDESSRRQAAQLAELGKENDRLSKLAGGLSLSKQQSDDLQRLRAEVGALRKKADGVAQLREQNRQLKAKTGQDKPMTPLQKKEAAVAKLGYGKNWAVGFYQYAASHGGQFPSSFDQAADFVPDEVKNRTDVTTDQFEVVFQGSPSALQNPQDIILLRETEAWDAGLNDRGIQNWAKVYTFLDGHSEIHHELQNDFTAYEQQHILPPTGTAH